MQTVRINCQSVSIPGTLVLPVHAIGLAIFAHASASGRQKPRNHFLTRFLAQRGVGVLLVDLLTPEEENEDRATGFFQEEPGFLAERLGSAAHWVRQSPERRLFQHLRLGCLGFGAAGTAALIAGAHSESVFGALVIAEGRPDQAGEAVSHLEVPTLLVLGETHDLTRRMNEIAFTQLPGEHDLKIIPGAGSLSNGDALEEVGTVAAHWFQAHLQAQHQSRRTDVSRVSATVTVSS
jgi:putative phosphoribosyl transferase